MADKKISALTEATTLAVDDLGVFVDISDTTDAPTGTTKRITVANLATDLEGKLNHDNLAGFVANEHIDHSSVSITAGTGLTGGGTIAATRTIDLDISTLTDDASPSGTHEIVTHNGSAMRKTDLTTAVNNAGAVMTTDSDLSTYSWFNNNADLGGGSASAVKAPSESSVKTYVDNEIGNIAAVEKVNVTTTDGTVSGTGTETAFYTVSIAGGTLGTNGAVMGRFRFSISTAAAATKTIRMKYGSTTVATIQIPGINTNSRSISGYADFYLLGAGSTSAQEASIHISVNDDDSIGNNADQDFITGGSASEDSTGALNLVFTVAQNSSDTFTMHNAFLTKM